MELVSPELALVDPALRASAATALPFPGDCLAVRQSRPIAIQLVSPARVENHQYVAATAHPPGSRGDRASTTSVSAVKVLVVSFLLAYFLGSPVVELLEFAAEEALPGALVHDSPSPW